MTCSTTADEGFHLWTGDGQSQFLRHCVGLIDPQVPLMGKDETLIFYFFRRLDAVDLFSAIRRTFPGKDQGLSGQQIRENIN